jgi:hypothetical protein
MIAGSSPPMTTPAAVGSKNLCRAVASDRVRHEKNRRAQHTDSSRESFFNESFDIVGAFA